MSAHVMYTLKALSNFPTFKEILKQSFTLRERMEYLVIEMKMNKTELSLF